MKVSSSGAKVTLKIVGGGRTNLKVRTADGDGINSLTATYQITSKGQIHSGLLTQKDILFRSFLMVQDLLYYQIKILKTLKKKQFLLILSIQQQQVLHMYHQIQT